MTARTNCFNPELYTGSRLGSQARHQLRTILDSHRDVHVVDLGDSVVCPEPSLLQRPRRCFEPAVPVKVGEIEVVHGTEGVHSGICVYEGVQVAEGC